MSFYDQANTLVPADATPLPSDEVLRESISKIAILAEGINGTHTFNTESAAYGYIESHWRIVIPSTLVDAVKTAYDSKGDEPLDAMDSAMFAYWNYVRMLHGKVNASNAMWIALYRARLAALGYLAVDKATRGVTVDEVDISDKATNFHKKENVTKTVKEKDTDGNDITKEVPANKYSEAVDDDATDEDCIFAYIKHGANESFKAFLRSMYSDSNVALIKHLTFAADQYAASVYLIFRQFGHHFQDTLANKYEVLWKATTLEKNRDYPGHEMVMRNAVHSLGVKSLHDKFFANLKAGKLAETFVERSNVAPAGTALVATCAASFRLLKGMPKYDDFEKIYGPQVKALYEDAKVLERAEAAIAYHKNARLFGKIKANINKENAAALAPLAKGLIIAMGSNTDMAKQKALDKSAGQNPILIDLMSSVITSMIREVSSEGSFAALQTDG